MYRRYNDEAQSKGVLVISATGVDSVPADVGTYYTEKCMGPGVTVDSVECFMGIRGGGFSNGTWTTLVHSISAISASWATRSAAVGCGFVLFSTRAEEKRKKDREGPSLRPVPTQHVLKCVARITSASRAPQRPTFIGLASIGSRCCAGM